MQLKKSAQTALKLLQVFLVISAAIVLITRQDHNAHDYSIGAHAWVTNAAEYRALAHQAFNAARTQVDTALSTTTSPIPPAIICDVDFTLLSNNSYEAFLITNQQTYPYKWRRWVNSCLGTALPGANEFIEYVHKKNIAIFYVTSRDITLKGATTKNLRKVGFPVKNNHVLCRTKKQTKVDHRRTIDQNYNVLAILGDQLRDFDHRFINKDQAILYQEIEQQKHKFGKRFIVFPNPIYGSWLHILTGNKRLPKIKELELLRKTLQS